MIIARITKKGATLFHGSVDIEGSPVGDVYYYGGWFPVESFGFGFEHQKDEKPDSPKAPAPRPSTRLGTAPSGKGEGSIDKGEDGPTIRLQKKVDMATTELMVLAMKAKSHKKAKERKDDDIPELYADIHVLGSVAYRDTKENYVYPSLLIHLEGIRVKKWSIDGQGDSRPSETVELLYDRVATQYVWTGDGKEFFPSKAAGWNQKEHRRWPSEEDGSQFVDWSSAPSFFKEFLPKV